MEPEQDAIREAQLRSMLGAQAQRATEEASRRVSYSRSGAHDLVAGQRGRELARLMGALPEDPRQASDWTGRAEAIAAGWWDREAREGGPPAWDVPTVVQIAYDQGAKIAAWEADQRATARRSEAEQAKAEASEFARAERARQAREAAEAAEEAERAEWARVAAELGEHPALAWRWFRSLAAAKVEAELAAKRRAAEFAARGVQIAGAVGAIAVCATTTYAVAKAFARTREQIDSHIVVRDGVPNTEPKVIQVTEPDWVVGASIGLLAGVAAWWLGPVVLAHRSAVREGLSLARPW